MKHVVIGGGSIGKRHLKNLYHLGERELFCLRRSYDKEFEIQYNCSVITTGEEVKSIKPDAIYVCTPTSLHHHGIYLARETGAHIFMEKPLTHSEAVLQNLTKKWKNDRLFFIGYVLRYHPYLNHIKEILENQYIGEVYSARFEFGSFLPSWHPGESASDGYAGNKSLGGGVINTIPHELDLMIHLFGQPQSLLTAKANLNHLNTDVEEIAESIFRYSWGLATIHLDFLQKDPIRNMHILGTSGKIVLDWNKNILTIKRFGYEPEEIKNTDFDFNQVYIDELKDFLKLIHLREFSHPLDFNYAVINTRWMLSMHKSSETEIIWEK